MKSRQIESKTAFPGQETERISCFETLGKKTQYFDYFRWVCNLQIAPRRRVFCQALEKLNGFWLFTRVDNQFLRLFLAIHLSFKFEVLSLSLSIFWVSCHCVIRFWVSCTHGRTPNKVLYTPIKGSTGTQILPQKTDSAAHRQAGLWGPTQPFLHMIRVGSPNKTLDLRAKMEVQCLACSQVHRTAS